jgi:hypothetical protein
MNGLYPIIRRVRRPLLPVEAPADAAAVVPPVAAPLAVEGLPLPPVNVPVPVEPAVEPPVPASESKNSRAGKTRNR